MVAQITSEYAESRLSPIRSNARGEQICSDQRRQRLAHPVGLDIETKHRERDRPHTILCSSRTHVAAESRQLMRRRLAVGHLYEAQTGPTVNV